MEEDDQFLLDPLCHNFNAAIRQVADTARHCERFRNAADRVAEADSRTRPEKRICIRFVVPPELMPPLYLKTIFPQSSKRKIWCGGNQRATPLLGCIDFACAKAAWRFTLRRTKMFPHRNVFNTYARIRCSILSWKRDYMLVC
jgi:hypothetical protein